MKEIQNLNINKMRFHGYEVNSCRFDLEMDMAKGMMVPGFSRSDISKMIDKLELRKKLLEKCERMYIQVE